MSAHLIGTSWKMNLTSTEADDWFTSFVELAADVRDVDVFVLPAFTSIWLARERLAGTGIAWGAQDVSRFESGAHTGEVSAAMLADLGCRYVEIGHAERRRDHGETWESASAKLAAVLHQGMTAIVCTGESSRVSTAAAIQQVIGDLDRQLGAVDGDLFDRIVIAYEPRWAIGGPGPASPPHVAAVHRAIADWLSKKKAGARSPIIYGGSVEPATAPELLAQPGVDGLFVGRCGLDPVAFAAIAKLAVVYEPASPT